MLFRSAFDYFFGRQKSGNYPVPAGASDVPGLEVAGVIESGDSLALSAAGLNAELAEVTFRPENTIEIEGATQPALVGGVPLAPEAAIAFLVASLQLLSPIKQISQYPATMAIALASAERVYALL